MSLCDHKVVILIKPCESIIIFARIISLTDVLRVTAGVQ